MILSTSRSPKHTLLLRPSTKQPWRKSSPISPTRVTKDRIKSVLLASFGPLPFGYCTNRSTEDGSTWAWNICRSSFSIHCSLSIWSINRAHLEWSLPFTAGYWILWWLMTPRQHGGWKVFMLEMVEAFRAYKNKKLSDASTSFLFLLW